MMRMKNTRLSLLVFWMPENHKTPHKQKDEIFDPLRPPLIGTTMHILNIVDVATAASSVDRCSVHADTSIINV